jgi:hypothetical protein
MPTGGRFRFLLSTALSGATRASISAISQLCRRAEIHEIARLWSGTTDLEFLATEFK